MLFIYVLSLVQLLLKSVLHGYKLKQLFCNCAGKEDWPWSFYHFLYRQSVPEGNKSSVSLPGKTQMKQLVHIAEILVLFCSIFIAITEKKQLYAVGRIMQPK